MECGVEDHDVSNNDVMHSHADSHNYDRLHSEGKVQYNVSYETHDGWHGKTLLEVMPLAEHQRYKKRKWA